MSAREWLAVMTGFAIGFSAGWMVDFLRNLFDWLLYGGAVPLA